MTIAVLAVQGAFIEHEQMLTRLGAHCIELREQSDMQNDFDGLVLPGGESTVQGKLLRELGLFQPLRDRITSGMPVLATCAGMILLAQRLVDDNTVHFGTMPITVRRNAYGRQLGSFHVAQPFDGLGELPMTFIRAPYVENAEPNVHILAQVDGKIVAAQYENQLALAFHPELDGDTRIHEYFLGMIRTHMLARVG